MTRVVVCHPKDEKKSSELRFFYSRSFCSSFIVYWQVFGDGNGVCSGKLWKENLIKMDLEQFDYFLSLAR